MWVLAERNPFDQERTPVDKDHAPESAAGRPTAARAAGSRSDPGGRTAPLPTATWQAQEGPRARLPEGRAPTAMRVLPGWQRCDDCAAWGGLAARAPARDCRGAGRVYGSART